MKTTAVRLYGAMDLRTETFELPEIGDDGVRVEIVSDSIGMSSYKAAVQGTAHKRPALAGKISQPLHNKFDFEVLARTVIIRERFQRFLGQRHHLVHPGGVVGLCHVVPLSALSLAQAFEADRPSIELQDIADSRGHPERVVDPVEDRYRR